jgi:flagellar hook-associated protein 3 FlgL
MEISLNSSLLNQLTKTSKQLTTGKQISTGADDSIKFTKVMDLSSDIAIMDHLKENAENAQAFVQYTDTTLSSMTEGLEQFKSQLIAYANTSHSTTSREALIDELTSLKNTILNLANTKVDGKYLFSGTATGTKPIGSNGEYQGNGEKMSIRTDKLQIQEYSISGQDLFLGYDRDVKNTVSTNVRKLNVTELAEGREVYINSDHTIKDLTGETGQVTFYLSGTRPDGTSFNTKYQVFDPEQTTVGFLEEEIKLAFNNQVDVEISNNGQFIITDKENGNPKMTFNMVGSNVDVNNLSDLEGEDTFDFVINEGAESYTGETLPFEKSGNKIKNNIQQFIPDTMNFATTSTALSEVAGKSLNGETLEFTGTDVEGNPATATITFAEGTSNVSINGTAFTFEKGGDDFTYQQMLDVISLTLSGGQAGDFIEARDVVKAELNHNGEFEIKDLTSSDTKMELAIFDPNSGDFTTNEGSAIAFNSNRALSFDSPTIDLFEIIDSAIEAVDQDISHPLEGDNNRGVHASLDALTHAIDHVIKERATSGSQYQSLDYTLERSIALKSNMEVTQSEVIATDFAEVSSYFTALKTNYEAMLMTVSQVQQLSLANYI